MRDAVLVEHALERLELGDVRAHPGDRVELLGIEHLTQPVVVVAGVERDHRRSLPASRRHVQAPMQPCAPVTRKRSSIAMPAPRSRSARSMVVGDQLGVALVAPSDPVAGEIGRLAEGDVARDQPLDAQVLGGRPAVPDLVEERPDA